MGWHTYDNDINTKEDNNNNKSDNNVMMIARVIVT